MIKRILLLMWILTSFPALGYEGKERVVWTKKPIKVALKVGEERIIHFPNPIEHWKPDVVKPFVVSQTVADVLYIRATNAFPETRFRIRDTGSNQMYLLDIQADDEAEVPNELVVIHENQLIGESKKQADTMARIQEDWRIRLTRFAAQQLYAPSRVAEEDYSISRSPMSPGLDVHLVRGGKIKAETIASWQGGGWYVHAVKLINMSDELIELDPRQDFRGAWSTTTLQHGWLSSKGTDESVTTVYFTSRQSFSESISLGGTTNDKEK